MDFKAKAFILRLKLEKKQTRLIVRVQRIRKAMGKIVSKLLKIEGIKYSTYWEEASI